MNFNFFFIIDFATKLITSTLMKCELFMHKRNVVFSIIISKRKVFFRFLLPVVFEFVVDG